MKKVSSILLILALLFTSALAQEAFAPGEWNGNVFTSTFGGYQFTKTDDMVIQDLAALSAAAGIDSDDLLEAAAFDFYLTTPTMDTITINYVNLGGVDDATAESTFAQMQKEQEAALAELGMAGESGEGELFGQPFSVSSFSITIAEGFSSHQKTYSRIVNGYIQTISITTMSEETTALLEAAFAPITPVA